MFKETLSQKNQSRAGWGMGGYSLDKALCCKSEDLNSTPHKGWVWLGWPCNPSIQLAETGIDLPELTGWPADTTAEHWVQLESLSLKIRQREVGGEDMMLPPQTHYLSLQIQTKQKALVVEPVGAVLGSHCSVDACLIRKIKRDNKAQ